MIGELQGDHRRFAGAEVKYHHPATPTGVRMRYPNRLLLPVLICVLCVGSAAAQTFRSPDPVIRRMWQVGMEQSQTETLAQVLIDSIGPRLSGTPGFQSAVEWLERKYREW